MEKPDVVPVTRLEDFRVPTARLEDLTVLKSSNLEYFHADVILNFRQVVDTEKNVCEMCFL